MYSNEEIRAAIQAHDEQEACYHQEIQEGLAIRIKAFKEDLARRALFQMGLACDETHVQAVLTYMEEHQMFS